MSDYWDGYNAGRSAAAGDSSHDGIGAIKGVVLTLAYFLVMASALGGVIIPAHAILTGDGRGLGGLLLMLLFNLSVLILTQTVWRRYKWYCRIHYGTSVRAMRERTEYEARTGRKITLRQVATAPT